MGRLAVAIGVASLLAAGGAASAALLADASEAMTATSPTATIAAASPTTTLEAPSVLAFSGRGWGHGLGLSQWGAYGYALHGWTYERILAHYYAGTTLASVRPRSVRVLVASKARVTLAATARWSVFDATGAKTVLAPGSIVLGPEFVVAGSRLSPPLTFSSRAPLAVDGRPYRGSLVAAPDGARVDVVDSVPLEQYLRAVVPSEMPSAWPPEALQAQAVAARSYALANISGLGPFDLYGDARSQVYGGIAAETAATDAAVAATSGVVVRYGGKVADTLFFSTSGGRTASALEATGVAVPYLVSVADPYDTLSPYHEWGPALYDAAAVARQLRLSSPITDVGVRSRPSGRVARMVLTTADETQLALTGNEVRTRLGLRSTWFVPALLELGPVAKAMTFGGAVTLSGAARGAEHVALEAKPVGGAWAAANDLILARDGTFSTLVEPQVSTAYRLAWGAARVGLSRVTVHARVSATVAQAAVTGTVRPASPGAPVELQEEGTNGAWQAVSSTASDAGGNFGFDGSLSAGTYRVRAAPGHGVAPGLSASFVVP